LHEKAIAQITFEIGPLEDVWRDTKAELEVLLQSLKS
jgi:hypothetical protein